MEQREEVPLLGPDQASGIEAGLTKLGILCVLCGRPTGEEGCDPREHVKVEPKLDVEAGTKPTIVLVKVVSCGREDCDREELTETSNAWRPYTPWTLVEQPAVDASS